MTDTPKNEASPKCTSWLGHRFVARYDTSPPNLTTKQINELFWVGYSATQRLTAPIETYVHDICVRCGHIVSPRIENHESPTP